MVLQRLNAVNLQSGDSNEHAQPVISPSGSIERLRRYSAGSLAPEVHIDVLSIVWSFFMPADTFLAFRRVTDVFGGANDE